MNLKKVIVYLLFPLLGISVNAQQGFINGNYNLQQLASQQQQQQFKNHNFKHNNNNNEFVLNPAKNNQLNFDPNQNQNQHNFHQAQVQQQQQSQFGFGMGNSQVQPQGPNQLRGGGGSTLNELSGLGVSAFGNGKPQFSSPVNGNEKPNEMQQPTPAAVQRPPPTLTRISFNSLNQQQGQTPFNTDVQSPTPSQAPGNPQYQSFQQQQQQQQEKPAQTQNQFNNGFQQTNPNLTPSGPSPPPPQNTWNSQPQLENYKGQANNNNGGEAKFVHNRFKVPSLKDEVKTTQTHVAQTRKPVSFEIRDSMNNNNNGLKFPSETDPSSSYSGFGQPEVNGDKNSKNTVKKGAFSWTSPEGQMYEITYTAASKSVHPEQDDKINMKHQHVKNNNNNNNGFYNPNKPSFPPTLPQPPRNNLEAFEGSPSSNNMVQFRPKNNNYQMNFNDGPPMNQPQGPPQHHQQFPSTHF